MVADEVNPTPEDVQPPPAEIAADAQPVPPASAGGGPPLPDHPDDDPIPHLRLLRQRLLGKVSAEIAAGSRSREGPDATVKVERALEQLPYCLEAAMAAVEDFAHWQWALCEPTGAAPEGSGGPRRIGPRQLKVLAFAVDHYLDAARRTQNAVVPYIVQALRVRVGKKERLHYVVDWIEQIKSPLPAKLQAIIRDYWHYDGLTLMRFRDLSQHYAVVSSDARVTRMDDGTRGVFLILPNNPEETKAAGLKYDEPTVHAFAYLVTSLEALHDFAYNVTKFLLTEMPDTGYRTVMLPFKAPMTIGMPTPGIGIPRSDDFIGGIINTCKNRLAAGAPLRPLTPLAYAGSIGQPPRATEGRRGPTIAYMALVARKGEPRKPSTDDAP